MSPGSQLDQPIAVDWNCFAYILSGEALFGELDTLAIEGTGRLS